MGSFLLALAALRRSAGLRIDRRAHLGGAIMATLTELSFGKRIQPEEVTPAVRDDLAHEEWQNEWTWLGLVAAFGVMVALGVSLTYRWHGEVVGAEIPAVIVVGVLTILGILVVQAIYMQRRTFVRNMPATRALVVSAEPTYKYADDGSEHLKRLHLRYVPRFGTQGDALELLIGETTKEAVADLSPHARDFAYGVDQGAMISVLYDPRHPDHVRVVERLVEHHHATVAA